jgi:hypothetical protein
MLNVQRIALALAASLLTCASANAANLVTNGDFATGDFTGWTLGTVNGGSPGFSPDPQVTSFNVTGGGVQNAAEFEVGLTALPVGPSGGASLSQTITTTAGMLTFAADWATFKNLGYNGDEGTFTVLLDGVSMVSAGGGLVGGGIPNRGTLDFSAMVTGGAHVLEIDITRTFLNLGGVTPYEYLTNISATQAVSAAPEPASWAMMLVGVFGAGAVLRRKRDSVRLA